MNRILEKMLKCQPGQQIIQEEAKKVADYINYINRAMGSSRVLMDTLSLRIMGLVMTVKTWEGETGAVTMSIADEYMEDFLSFIGEEAEYILAGKDMRCSVRIFWSKEYDDAYLVWGSDSFTRLMGQFYHSNGIEYADCQAQIYFTDEPLKEKTIVEQNIVIGDNYGNVGGQGNVVSNSPNDMSAFFMAMEELHGLSVSLPASMRQEFNDCIEVLEEEIPKNKPKMGLLRKSWESVKRIGSSPVFQKAIETAAPIVVKKLLEGM